MPFVNITIDDIRLQVPKEATILEAAQKANIKIPTLCHLELHNRQTVNQVASCRICVVEVDGRRNLAPACSTKVANNMVIRTHSPRVLKSRRVLLQLLLSNHPKDCLNCYASGSCELQDLANQFHTDKNRFEGESSTFSIETSSEAITRDLNKCIRCRRCETACNDMQTVGVLSGIGRGFNMVVGPAFHDPLQNTQCVFCGQCVKVCPTGALMGKSHIDPVWDAINNPDKVVIVQTAPAVRAALGEEFGMEPGHTVTKQMATGLRRLGFDYVFDTNFAADLTIMEEATEFLHRVQHGGRLPMLTSCCPAWVKFFEHQFQDLLDVPSTCKSPQEMFGAIAKTYWAQKMGIDPAKIVVVSVMPCLSKKYEASRKELSASGFQDVDYVLSTRELARMFREAGIDFLSLAAGEFDNPLGFSTGGADIFAASGGVCEAALRMAAEVLSGQPLENVDFEEVRGQRGLRHAGVEIAGKMINVAIASGLGNARRLLEEIRSGKSNYHLIEIMACPGGCVGGGGQPFVDSKREYDVIRKRSAAIYAEDAGKEIRSSQKNPYIQQLYKEFLGEPHGEKAHQLLHTGYTPREKL
ncbi:MAG: NADH-dependent [FeFe] hydrogenase, group A6 [Lentisphaeria bacterium]